MSRPRYYWFGFVQRTIDEYLMENGADSYQGRLAEKAISEAVQETALLPDGGERIKLIMLLYGYHTPTIARAADLLYISESTAKRWNNQFVYSVADKMGFLNWHKKAN